MITSTGGVGKLGKFSTNKIFTLGYTSTTPEELLQIATERDALVLDIRLKAWSMAPRWRVEALQELLEKRYIGMSFLGNLNYKSGGLTVLNNPERGLELVTRYLVTGGDPKSVILLCACWSHVTCHRLVAAKLIAGETGCEIEHLYGSRKEGK